MIEEQRIYDALEKIKRKYPYERDVMWYRIANDCIGVLIDSIIDDFEERNKWRQSLYKEQTDERNNI